MSQANGVQTLTALCLTRQSQEALHQLLDKLGHLDLTGKLSTEDGTVQVTHSGNGGIYVAFCWIGSKRAKVALERLRFYIYNLKDREFAEVCGPTFIILRLHSSRG